ncbi:hypothetical protein BDK51DRAFT_40428 [Blyttiomyces helicus]|uniref:Uncharacterized protein n=1 Tax=Blyttiomyces helicus TaxID=388810 RepID=A0A4P9WJU4_9FUNG|nr:hypothetical protein BDK51DRAFT_40428 [Blyttiomyces helicus]|eukprot:RKO90926.1 hypothetical protein BDK51DRAFT_40428 [Blyttiomyces helicus]
MPPDSSPFPVWQMSTLTLSGPPVKPRFRRPHPLLIPEILRCVMWATGRFCSYYCPRPCGSRGRLTTVLPSRVRDEGWEDLVQLVGGRSESGLSGPKRDNKFQALAEWMDRPPGVKNKFHIFSASTRVSLLGGTPLRTYVRSLAIKWQDSWIPHHVDIDLAGMLSALHCPRSRAFKWQGCSHRLHWPLESFPILFHACPDFVAFEFWMATNPLPVYPRPEDVEAF